MWLRPAVGVPAAAGPAGPLAARLWLILAITARSARSSLAGPVAAAAGVVAASASAHAATRGKRTPVLVAIRGMATSLLAPRHGSEAGEGSNRERRVCVAT